MCIRDRDGEATEWPVLVYLLETGTNRAATANDKPKGRRGDGVASSSSVSYTHLDVYKRQPMSRTSKWWGNVKQLQVAKAALETERHLV